MHNCTYYWDQEYIHLTLNFTPFQNGCDVIAPLYMHAQARSQDRFWGGAKPQKSGPFEPKKWTFLNLTPLP